MKKGKDDKLQDIEFFNMALIIKDRRANIELEKAKTKLTEAVASASPSVHSTVESHEISSDFSSPTKNPTPPPSLRPPRLPVGIAPSNQIGPPSHGARHRALRRWRRQRHPHSRGGGDDSPGHPPLAAAADPLRVLRGGALLRPCAGEPGAQGVERAGAAAAEQPPHRHRLPPAPPAAPPPRRRAPGPAPPRALPPRSRLPPRPTPARALLAGLPPLLPQFWGPLPRAHALRRVAWTPRAALRAAAQGRGRRGARRVPPRPLGPAVRRRRRRAPRAYGRGLLRAPRSEAAARRGVRDGHRAGRGRAGGQGGRVLPARRQRRRWSRLRGVV